MSIRDDFFANQAVAALWDVAVSIKRGNPLPLDSNSVFKSYADLETYASGVLAYPGQIVAVVNADSTEIYFLDQELTIKPVGSVPTTDNKSIQVTDGILSLYNFGTSYYKFIAETINEENQEIIPAHYEKVDVSDKNPWDAGLEPRVVQEDGQFVIGWYEPNLTTIDGVQTQIADLQKTVEELEVTTSKIDNKADKDSVYTKTETDALIASADHLKRKIFDTFDLAQEFVNGNLETADQYIYMVPTGLSSDSNRYYEYMAIDGILESVGNWEVDLNDYFTEDELRQYLEGYYTETEVDAILVDYAKKTDLEGYYNINQIDTILAKYYTSEKVNELLNNYVLKETGKSLVLDSEINKLATITANAEPNYIKSVSSDFTVSEAGRLNLVSISIAQVQDLQEVLNNKADRKFDVNADGSKTEWILLSPENQKKLEALNLIDNKVSIQAENVADLDTWITNNRNSVAGLFSTTDSNKLLSIEEGAQVNFIKSVDTTQMNVDENGHLTIISGANTGSLPFTSVSNDFNIDEDKTLQLSKTYVETSLYQSEVGDLSSLLHVSGKENSTIVDEVNYINERLRWTDMY